MATKHDRKRWKTRRGRRLIAAEREHPESSTTRYEPETSTRGLKNNQAGKFVEHGRSKQTSSYSQ